MQESKPGPFPANPERFKKKAPKGVYDKNLVCEPCERQWAHYDDYAKTFFLEELKTKLVEHPDFHGQAFMISVEDFDYIKLKLFYLSILWRASASKEEFYEKVDLGPFTERLKEMIESRDPGRPEEFPILFKIFEGPGAEKQMMSPTKEKINGRNNYRLYHLRGICAQIKVDRQPLEPDIEQCILKPDQPMLLYKQNILESNELKNYFRNHTEKSVNKFRP